MTMDTKALLAEAEALKPQLLTDRRTLHRDPEVGPSLPRTAAYVTERLMALGYNYALIGSRVRQTCDNL